MMNETTIFRRRISVLVVIALNCSAAFGFTRSVASTEEAPSTMIQQEGEPRHTNRLARETSPYLLQHAHNPVDWHPWGPEAIELARRENRPIFLSIGYSTCYWCHVMERESFENEATAKVMNRDFVCIKVDREQRPDVDEIYMTSCQVFTRMTTGRASGGWPLSVFIDPFSLKPYFVGTYFPPVGGQGRPGFVEVCESMSMAWKTQHEAVVDQSNRIAAIVADTLAAGEASRALGRTQVTLAVDRLMGSHDRENGGFGGAPKFPQPVFLELLLEGGGDKQAVEDVVAFTLDRMAMGGMYDQVGGGFHRYSTDARWLVPHFEKMLYDNGQLASLYADSYERTGDAFHAKVLRETLDYVLREMTDEASGGFYSAQDAEVNTHEGENYLWTADQVRTVLDEAGLAADVPKTLKFFGLDLGTNFQDPHHRELPPNNVLFLPVRPDVFAREQGMSDEEMSALIDRITPPLYAERMKRDQPGLDDKIITGWNGLMIRGMADGGRALADDRYLDAARRSARYILESMRNESGGLMRTSRNGEVAIPAFLEDYAFLARGLIALYDATGEDKWLTAAAEVIEAARARFWGDDGAWFDTEADQDDLFVRSRNLGDGAVPSGIGTMLLVLPAMAERTGETWYLDDFQSAMTRLSGSFAGNPVGSSYATIATSRALAENPDRLPGEGSTTPDRVVASIEPAELRFDDSGRAEVFVSLDIGEGFHVNAHEPGDQSLVGLAIKLEGASGVSIEADYPEGELYRESIRVHARKVRIPVVLQRTGPMTGEPTLVVTWQACTDQVCHAPASARLALDVKAQAK
jgi:uncharacterized protein YyaL (SSP411 family)